MNRTVLILAVVVVLGIGGYYLLNQSGQSVTGTVAPDTATTETAIEATEEAASDAVTATENTVEDAASSLVEQGTEAAEQASDAVTETVEQATDAASDAVEAATEQAGEAAQAVTETAGQAVEQAGDAASSVVEQGTEALANLTEQVTGQGLGNAGEALFQSITETGLLSPEGFDYDKVLSAFQAGGLGEGVMTQVKELLAQMRDNPDTFSDTLETLKNLVTG